MLTCAAEPTAADDIGMAAHDNLETTAPLKLSHQVRPTGEAVVELSGDLDIATAEMAVSYVSDLIERPPRAGNRRPHRAGLLRRPWPIRPGPHGQLRRAERPPIPAGVPQPITDQDHADHRAGPQISHLSGVLSAPAEGPAESWKGRRIRARLARIRSPN